MERCASSTLQEALKCHRISTFVQELFISSLQDHVDRFLSVTKKLSSDDADADEGDGDSWRWR